MYTRALAQSHGPRDAVVTDDGRVVMLDEWINVASEWAVTIDQPHGGHTSAFGYGTVARISGENAAELASTASSGAYGRGTWLSSRPAVKGEVIEVKAGRRTLRIAAEAGIIARKG